jgi:pantoate--beta-alanine ligase
LEVFHTKARLQNRLTELKTQGKTIGFVPTMGALHSGHISLIKQALKDNDIVVCSIFVNPTQFNEASDLQNYPRPIENDTEMLEEVGCSILFVPEVDEMYQKNEKWDHHFGKLEDIFEGKFRPGHFKGVGQIVKKLLDVVKPDKAYFGQKDYQQFMIIQKLVNDFSIPVELVAFPIVRETSGLAMSSRNTRLTPLQKENASNISQVLFAAKNDFEKKSIHDIKEEATRKLNKIPDSKLEYFEIVDGNDLSIIDHAEEATKVVAIVAIRVGNIRLIDNMILKG